MRTALTTGLIVLSLVSFAACGGDDKPAADPSAQASATPPPAPAPVDTTPPPAPAPAPVDTTPAKPAEVPLTDAQIVGFTSAANNGEIDMANLAQKQGTSADVKGFASMMLSQHKDMEAKGKALATKAKITPADSDATTALKSDVTSTIDSLKGQKGKDFDKAYIAANVKAHTDVLAAFDNKLIPAAQNADLKTLLTDARGHVAAHLDKAKEIQAKMDAAPAAAPTKK